MNVIGITTMLAEISKRGWDRGELRIENGELRNIFLHSPFSILNSKCSW
jgi:hypothetical protein